MFQNKQGISEADVLLSIKTRGLLKIGLLSGIFSQVLSCNDVQFFGKAELAAGKGDFGEAPGPTPPASSDANPPVSENFPVVITAIKRKPIYTLIVADNSSSMNTKIEPMRMGLSTLRDSLFLPEDRVGIQRMNLLTEDLTELHPIHSRYENMKFEPGTSSLVSQERIEEFKSVVSEEYASKYPLDGPDTAWFHPKAVHPVKKHSLMDAALQNPYYGTTLEAGIFALHQMLQRRAKNAPNTPFTRSFALNVVFISDEAHPGCQNIQNNPTKKALCDELISQCPTLQALTMAFEGAGIKTFKFHGAIAPGDKGHCSYRELITATGGKAINIGTDPAIYAQFFEAVHSDPPGDTITLKLSTKHKLSRNIKVTADEKTITDFKIIDDHNLEVEVPKAAKDVRVTFPDA